MQAVASSSKTNSQIKLKAKHAFDAQAFLDSAGVARKIVQFRRTQKIYAQGDPATSVMYI
jgi:CRP-like cAMP-binding protein